MVWHHYVGVPGLGLVLGLLVGCWGPVCHCCVWVLGPSCGSVVLVSSILSGLGSSGGWMVALVGLAASVLAVIFLKVGLLSVSLPAVSLVMA